MTLCFIASKALNPNKNLTSLCYFCSLNSDFNLKVRFFFLSHHHFFHTSTTLINSSKPNLKFNAKISPRLDFEVKPLYGLYKNLILRTAIENPGAFRDTYWTAPHYFNALVLDSDLFLSIVNSIRDRPSTVLRMFRWAGRQKGYKHSEFVVCSVLEVLVKNGIVGSAYSVMERVVVDSGMCSSVCEVLIDGYLSKEVSCKVFDLLLWVYTKRSDVEGCLVVFEKMVRNGFLPDVKNCNRVLRVLKDRGLVGEARKVYDLMGDYGIKATIVTYNTMLDMYWKVSLQQGIDFVREAHMSSGNDVTYNVLINGLSRNGKFEIAKELISEMLNRGLKVSPYTYNSLISGYCRKGMLVEALGFEEEMKSRRALPTVFTYNAYMHGYCKQGWVDYAKQWISVMLKKNLAMDIISYNILIYGYCVVGDTNEALLLLSELRERNLSPSVVTYNTIIHGLSREGDLKSARELKDEMIKFGISPDIFTYTILINGSYRIGNLFMAKEFYDEMLRKGLEPDHVAYTTCIVGELKLSDVSAAYKLKEEMLLKGFPPDVITYNVLVDGISKLGDLREACELLKKMNDDGVEPDHVTYTSIIHNHLESGFHLSKARDWFNEMVNRGVSPTVVTYTVLIHAHAGAGNLELAFWYLSKMQENNILPNVITYNALINGLCKLRKTDKINEAYRVFSEMQSKGIVPNKYTYTIMINGNCDRGNWQEALRLYIEMIDRGIEPDTCTHSALFKYLNKDYKSVAIQELERIILDDRDTAEAIT